MLCPCGSNLSFSTCCQPFISKAQLNKPNTPEQLMRSRFSAYALKDGQYIYDTYGEKQRVNLTIEDLQSWADECNWLALTIHDSTESTVDFSAYYVINSTLCELREKSNFAKEYENDQEQWRYIDGTITKNNEIATVKRNDICPCNQYSTAWSPKKNKKFKHCCGK